MRLRFCLMVSAGVLLVLSAALYVYACHAPAGGINCPGNSQSNPWVRPYQPLDPANWQNVCEGGHPVNLYTGEFFTEVTDLTIPGRGLDFEFKRSYNSRYQYNGVVGYNWSWSYNEYLFFEQGSSDAYHVAPDLRERLYTWDGTKYITPSGAFNTLVKNGDNTHTLKERGGLAKHFRTDGYMDWLEDAAGNRITLIYDEATKRCTSVVDTLNRTITITYGSLGRIKEVQDFAGRVLKFGYHESTDDLTWVTGPSTAEFPAGKSVVYTYSTGNPDPLLNHNLVTMTDPRGNVYLTSTYNSDDRVSQQTYGSGTFVFTYNFGGPNRITTVTDRVGNVTDYKFNSTGQAIEEKRYTRGIRPGDPAFFLTTNTFSADGLKTKTVLPRGNVITYVYDSANPDRLMQYNLLSERRKAADVADGADDLVTAWTYESRYNQVKTKTDPKGFLTTNYYDYEEATLGDLNGDGRTDQDNGKLVKVVHPQVTTGQPVPQDRVELFTQNDFGQELTHQDAEGNVTKREYYGAGAQNGYLWKRTADWGVGKLNLVTEFTYDSVGNVLTTKDPRTVVTTFTVNALNLVTKVSVTGTVNGNPVTYEKEYTYDGNNNVTMERVKNFDENGNPGTPMW